MSAPCSTSVTGFVPLSANARMQAVASAAASYMASNSARDCRLNNSAIFAWSACGIAIDHERPGAQGLPGAHGLAGAPRPEAGEQGLSALAGPQGEAELPPRPEAGAQGLPAPRPLVAGEQGLSPRAAGPRPGAQGLPAPQGLRAACATWNEQSAGTGAGAGAVAAIAAAAMVDRLPASSAVFNFLVCIGSSLFNWFAGLRFRCVRRPRRARRHSIARRLRGRHRNAQAESRRQSRSQR